MDRRELLKMIVASTGAAFVSSNVLAWGLKVPATDPSKIGISKDHIKLISEVAETIIPRTDTPGAKDAQCAPMIAVLVADCYTPLQQQAFKDGLRKLNLASDARFNLPFLALSKAQRFELLTVLDAEAKKYNAERNLLDAVNERPNSRDVGDTAPLPHYFTMFKQLTLFTFFTSEVAANKVLRYIGIPGKYDGDLPYEKGDRAWAT